MEDKLKLCVLFGGVSSEHDVSLETAFSVLKNLDRKKYEIYPVGITKGGEWYLYGGEYENIPGGAWEKDPQNLPAYILPISGGFLNIEYPGGITRVRLGCVFSALHGANGEDGSMQGLMQLAGIPCVGSGVTASAAAMDKAITNALADSLGIKQAEWEWFYIYDYNKDPSAVIKRLENRFSYPVFVKPACAGSSVGISKAKNSEELREAIRLAGEQDRKVIVEESIDGRELEVSVLGNNELFVTQAAEIMPDEEFYSYASKYLNGKSEIDLSAKLLSGEMGKLRSTASLIYKALGCAGLSRVDFFLRSSDGEILFNEINTIPGFTSISVYSKLIDKAGISYSELLDRLIALALEAGGGDIYGG